LQTIFALCYGHNLSPSSKPHSLSLTPWIFFFFFVCLWRQVTG
jgi:hypothetical protein